MANLTGTKAASKIEHSGEITHDIATMSEEDLRKIIAEG
jgi:hypothetical protein